MSWEENEKYIVKSLEKLIEGQEKMEMELSSVHTQMAEYNGQLEQHIAGVRNAESSIHKLNSRVGEIEKKEIEKQAIRLYKKAAQKKLMMWLGALATLASILAFLKPLLIKLLSL